MQNKLNELQLLIQTLDNRPSVIVITEVKHQHNWHSHHHHHRFYVCFSTLAQVRRFPINSSPPGHPVLCIFFSQLKLSHTLHCTLMPCFSASASTFFTFYHQISACCNPIILILTFNVPKPSQSTKPYHINHTFNTQPT